MTVPPCEIVLTELQPRRRRSILNARRSKKKSARRPRPSRRLQKMSASVKQRRLLKLPNWLVSSKALRIRPRMLPSSQVSRKTNDSVLRQLIVVLLLPPLSQHQMLHPSLLSSPNLPPPSLSLPHLSWRLRSQSSPLNPLLQCNLSSLLDSSRSRVSWSTTPRVFGLPTQPSTSLAKPRAANTTRSFCCSSRRSSRRSRLLIGTSN